MGVCKQRQLSVPVSVVQERRLPGRAIPAGYSALSGACKLFVPLPRTLFAIGERHRVLERGGWRILTPRHAPRPTLEGHLTFALKYEGLDLAVLKRLFLAVGPGEIEALMRAPPTGSSADRQRTRLNSPPHSPPPPPPPPPPPNPPPPPPHP